MTFRRVMAKQYICAKSSLKITTMITSTLSNSPLFTQAK